MKISKFAFLLAAVALLAGCNDNHGTSSNQSEESEQTDVTDTDSGENLPEWVDYSEMPETHLQLDYEGRDFFVDGVGQVEKFYPIDGDTAHFDMVVKTTSSERVKARFYGIDTPESTGDVQPWGRKASNYTKSVLSEAMENGTIVVTADIYDEYRQPTHDSTGERYLCCVYVNTEKKNAPKEEMKLLNLMIVEAGYSWARNTGNIPELSEYFLDAQIQSSAYKLYVFSDEQDPDYNYGGYVQTSLLDMQNEQRKLLTAEHLSGIPYDGSHTMPLTGSADGIVGQLDDDVEATEFRAVLMDPETGKRIEADSTTDLGGTSTEPVTYLIGIEDTTSLTYYYATGDVLENGEGLEVTANLAEAGTFESYRTTGGFVLKHDEMFLGYDVNDEGYPYLAYDEEKDWVWEMDSDQSLSILLQFYYDNKNVTIQGTVIGSSNNILYIQDVYEDEDTGEQQYAGVNVFPGMGAISSRFTIPNTYVEIKGTATNSQFGFQITGCNFPRVSMGFDDECSVIMTAEENIDIHQLHPFEMTAEELSKEAANFDLTHLGCFVRVTDPLECTDVYIPEGDNAEATIYFGDYSFSVYKTFLYKGDPDRPTYNWVTKEDFIGKKFQVEGMYTYHKGQTSGRISFQINPNDASGLVWVQE